MIDKLIGLALMLSAVICFALAGMPIVQSLLGGTVYGQMKWMAMNMFWLAPIGAVLYFRLWATPNAYVAAVVLISMGALYFFTAPMVGGFP